MLAFHFIDSKHVAIPVYTRLFSIKSAAKHLASCTWGINRIVREIALHLALNFTSLEALHVWSEDNVWADQLSRGECPPELRSVPQVVDPPNLWRFE